MFALLLLVSLLLSLLLSFVYSFITQGSVNLKLNPGESAHWPDVITHAGV